MTVMHYASCGITEQRQSEHKLADRREKGALVLGGKLVEGGRRKLKKHKQKHHSY
jgi:hypothetical protein